ncbi:Transposase [Mycobacteroides abscessus subsp. massiliense]|nr:Transposase [Mycobacteroides abscessus subsp. massiliense]SKH06409.1 Transposase [Mycobacteroides abscessus subsp. massiliense]SKJ45613.1 Transposase [Mycobacteroides abscessus subsp. massiliense]SKJ83909.1 Transposase [Mycobacteroides abscessus subsp. massiliense]SKL05164.1 Transposase [Mycobacteroides abscessus subsp. massiliense]
MLAVISDGLSITQVASKVGVSRQTLHAWLVRYEAEGLDGLADRSHRPVSCPHQMPAQVEATVLELRRSRPYWGPRRLVFELAKRKVSPVPSESAVYRALLRAGLIDPSLRDRRSRKWKRWERGAPMELWQMDVVGGFPAGRRDQCQGFDRDRRSLPDVCLCPVDDPGAHPRGL